LANVSKVLGSGLSVANLFELLNQVLDLELQLRGGLDIVLGEVEADDVINIDRSASFN